MLPTDLSATGRIHGMFEHIIFGCWGFEASWHAGGQLFHSHCENKSHFTSNTIYILKLKIITLIKSNLAWCSPRTGSLVKIIEYGRMWWHISPKSSGESHIVRGEMRLSPPGINISCKSMLRSRSEQHHTHPIEQRNIICMRVYDLAVPSPNTVKLLALMDQYESTCETMLISYHIGWLIVCPSLSSRMTGVG